MDYSVKTFSCMAEILTGGLRHPEVNRRAELVSWDASSPSFPTAALQLR